MIFPTSDRTSTQNAQVIVQRNIPYENDHGWNTLQNLGYHGPPLGAPWATSDALLKFIIECNTLGTIYANPMSKVTSPVASAAFFNSARREQSAWRRQLTDRLTSSSSVKRFFSKAEPFVRQLEFTGVMIVDGNLAFPSRWPEPKQLPKNRPCVGDTFGKLLVLEMLPKGRCRCRCQCPSGRETIVRKKHLLAGRAKSCGCERIKLEARIQMMREARSRS